MPPKLIRSLDVRRLAERSAAAHRAMWSLPAACIGYLMTSPALMHGSQPNALRSCLSMKKSPDETPEQRPECQVQIDSIVEFHDPKHGAGAATPVLGLVKGVEYKAKGGARVQIVDAAGGMHAVAENALHINLGVYKGKLKEVSHILKDYADIMETDSTDLGVEPEVLEVRAPRSNHGW